MTLNPRICAYIAMLLLFALPLAAQSDSSSLFIRLLNRFTKDDSPPERPRFLAYPTIGYSPETSFEFGIASSLLFHAKLVSGK